MAFQLVFYSLYLLISYALSQFKNIHAKRIKIDALLNIYVRGDVKKIRVRKIEVPRDVRNSKGP